MGIRASTYLGKFTILDYSGIALGIIEAARLKASGDSTQYDKKMLRIKRGIAELLGNPERDGIHPALDVGLLEKNVERLGGKIDSQLRQEMLEEYNAFAGKYFF